MILSGLEVVQQIKAGRIVIDPFTEDRVNPVSVDLTLGNEVAVYSGPTYSTRDSRREGYRGEDIRKDHLSSPMDSKVELQVKRYTIDPDAGWVLNPGIGYLMHTAERVWTDSFVPILDGKSSIGRLFIKIHETAGFGDPGFNGQYTLEVTSQFPVVVYPGMRICQIRFHSIQGEIRNYDGNYVGEQARGPIPSRAWRSAFK